MEWFDPEKFHDGEKSAQTPGFPARYVLDISKEKLKAAPGFDPDKWPSMHEEKWNRDVYKYYGHSPYWE